MSGGKRPGEFELIARYFAPLAAGEPGTLGLRDDAVVLKTDPEKELVITADALVAGVHFRNNDAPDQIARKAIRVNLSDLAAKGAKPRGYLLTLALAPEIDEAWVLAFAGGLAGDQAQFGLSLLGGDTTSTPGPTTISVTALGEVAKGCAMRRTGAVAGDDVYVSGTIGDGTLGLHANEPAFRVLSAAEREFLGRRYLLPMPRVSLGEALASSRTVHAAADISDGLVADLGHIAEASKLDAVIEAAKVPHSAAAVHALVKGLADPAALLTGGDDYELVFTASPSSADTIAAITGAAGVPVVRIGRMEAARAAAPAVRVLDETGKPLTFARKGFTHF